MPERIDVLEQTIIDARVAYYEGSPHMSDKTYEQLLEKLKKIRPESPIIKQVGYFMKSSTSKTKHVSPMGSLNNAMNEKEFIAWFNKYSGGTRMVIAEHKMDGSSVELIYEGGTFVKAITRGDGYEGEDVTRNALLSNSFPLHLRYELPLSVKCECMILKKDFEEYFIDESNSRNSASGTLRNMKDNRLAKYLKIYAYTAVQTGDNANEEDPTFDKESRIITFLSSEGFETPKTLYSNELSVLIAYFNEVLERRNEIPYEIDGVVMKINDVRASEKYGMASELIPAGQVAYKFPPRGDETVIESVDWQVGHTGVVTPVARVRPVTISGVTIRNVTLCNKDEINRLGVAIGDTVEVVRAGDVIPKISKVMKKGKIRESIKWPKRCPECDRPLEAEGAYVKCLADDTCPGIAKGMITHWVRERNILGIGDSIIYALVENGMETVVDLYLISEKELAKIDMDGKKLGSARAKSIMTEINKSRTVSVSDFFGSLGIPTLGKSLAERIVSSLRIKKPEDFVGLTTLQFSRVDGIGQIRALKIKDWLEKHLDFLVAMVEQLTFEKEVEATSNRLGGKSFCFTGDAGMRREKLQELVRMNGGEVKTSATKDLAYLVCAETTSTSTKAQKARANGTELITVDEFLSMVKWDGTL